MGFEEFAATSGRRLRAALVAAYGPDIGLDAAAEVQQTGGATVESATAFAESMQRATPDQWEQFRREHEHTTPQVTATTAEIARIVSGTTVST